MPRGRPGGLLGFTMADRVAVREVVERQTPLRQEICRLLAGGYSQRDAAEALGVSWSCLNLQVRAVRAAFVSAGFEDWQRRIARRKKRTQWDLTRLKRRRKEALAERRRMLVDGKDLQKGPTASGRKWFRTMNFLRAVRFRSYRGGARTRGRTAPAE